jgi:hypothetical protein
MISWEIHPPRRASLRRASRLGLGAGARGHEANDGAMVLNDEINDEGRSRVKICYNE